MCRSFKILFFLSLVIGSISYSETNSPTSSLNCAFSPKDRTRVSSSVRKAFSEVDRCDGSVQHAINDFQKRRKQYCASVPLKDADLSKLFAVHELCKLDPLVELSEYQRRIAALCDIAASYYRVNGYNADDLRTLELEADRTSETCRTLEAKVRKLILRLQN